VVQFVSIELQGSFWNCPTNWASREEHIVPNRLAFKLRVEHNAKGRNGFSLSVNYFTFASGSPNYYGAGCPFLKSQRRATRLSGGGPSWRPSDEYERFEVANPTVWQPVQSVAQSNFVAARLKWGGKSSQKSGNSGMPVYWLDPPCKLGRHP
jgi:hypothetical protein